MRYKTEYRKTISQKLIKTLLPATREDGELRSLFENFTSTERARTSIFLCRTLDKKLVGYSCIYSLFCALKGYKKIGVFVLPEYRHHGIGTRLKNMAIRYCERNKIFYRWYDGKTDKWHSVWRKNINENTHCPSK